MRKYLLLHLIFVSTFASKSFGQSVEELLQQGIELTIKKQYEEALGKFDKCIKKDAKNADAYYNRAIVYASTGKIEEALQDYSTVIEITPKYTAAYINRAAIHSANSDYKDALSDLNKAIELSPSVPEAYNNRGYTYSL